MSRLSIISSLRVAIAHPFPLVVEALRAIVTDAGFTAVTDVAHEARRAVLVQANVAVVALQFGGMDVLKVRRAAGVPTVVMFDQPNLDALLAAVGLAAEGIVLTTSPTTSVTACLTAVVAGKQWIDPEATRLIIDRVAHPAAPALTRREHDVATLVAAGQRNRTIADALKISEGTVKMHLHNVYAKLCLESRTQLAMEFRARPA